MSTPTAVRMIPVPGARLATDVTLPDGDGPFPALVLRTPYGRRHHRAEARAWAARGFAAVVQDVRGRHASEGRWRPYATEAADGTATLRWVRAQSWSDGRVVAAGASYAAYCALVTAVGDGVDAEDPRRAAHGADSGPGTGESALPGRRHRPGPAVANSPGAEESAASGAGPDGPGAYPGRSAGPVTAPPAGPGETAAAGRRPGPRGAHRGRRPDLATARGDGAHEAPHTPPDPRPAPAAHDLPDAVIASVPALGAAEVAREPSGVERLLARAGWWAAHGDRADSDTYALDAALDADPGLLDHLPVADLPRRIGRDMPSWPGIWRRGRRDLIALRGGSARMPLLAVGGTRDPFAADVVALWSGWGGPARLLLGPWGHALTAAPAPEARPGHRLDLGGLQARWARAALDGALTADSRSAVALGDSEHWYAADGPRPRRSWRFGAADSAQGLRLLHGGDFTADPARPVRSDRLDVPADGAPDRAVLLTPPLPRPLDLCGPAEARLCVSADTPAADWFVRLVALDPHGRAAPLALGTARRADPPGGSAEFTVPLGRLSRRLAPGTRLRLEIAGHHFPAHARNPHTGRDPVTATRLTPSRRTVRTEGGALSLTTGHGRRVDPVQEMCA